MSCALFRCLCVEVDGRCDELARTSTDDAVSLMTTLWHSNSAWYPDMDVCPFGVNMPANSPPFDRNCPYFDHKNEGVGAILPSIILQKSVSSNIKEIQECLF